MKIIYISYSCDPYNGSEDQIGFNIPLASYNSGNEVIVITKKEHENNISKFLNDNPNIRIKYHYIDIPQMYKMIYTGLFYSMRIIIWQKRAKSLVEKICKNERFDIIHQVAPVEYRAIGDYGNIYNTKYILGPIGGGFDIPNGLKDYAKNHFLLEFARGILNSISFKLLKKSKKLKGCEHVFFTNEETKHAFDKQKIQIDDSKWSYHCDIGASESNISLVDNDVNGAITFLIPGRLNYRKGHELLFDAIPRRSFDRNVIYKIIGVGPLERKLKRIVYKDEYLREHVYFTGKIKYIDMNKEYDKSNVVILPSLSEATGTVLIEAMSRSRAVITGKYFGAKFLLDDDCSWLFYGRNKNEIVSSLHDSLVTAITNTSLVVEKGVNAYNRVRKFKWSEKITLFNDVYNRALWNPKEKE